MFCQPNTICTQVFQRPHNIPIYDLIYRWNQRNSHIVPCSAFAKLYGEFITGLLGNISFRVESCYISYKRKEFPMFAIAVSIGLLLLLALSGANLFVSNLSSDELNNMGVEIRS